MKNRQIKRIGLFGSLLLVSGYLFTPLIANSSDCATQPVQLAPFSAGLSPGSVFEQKRFTILLNKRLAAPQSEWIKVPVWVDDVLRASPKVPTTDGWWVYNLQQSGWGCGIDSNRHKIDYEYHRDFEPETNKDCFVVRSSDVYFGIEAKKGDPRFHQTSLDPWAFQKQLNTVDTGKLTPGKVTYVWQRENITTYKKVSDKRVQSNTVRLAFGQNGKPLAKPPEGIYVGPDSAEIDIAGKQDPRLIEETLRQYPELVSQLESFLTRQKKHDELAKVKRAIADLKRRTAKAPADTVDTIPGVIEGFPNGPITHPGPRTPAKEYVLYARDLPRKGAISAGSDQGRPLVLNSCIALARSGNADAEYGIGWIYVHGTYRTVQNPKLAEHWYRKAAAHGSAAAQDELGWMYESGKLVPRNYPEALKWYQLAATQKDAEAQYDLARMHEKGYGTKVDFQKAMSFYEAAYKGKVEQALMDIERLWVRNLASPSRETVKGEPDAFHFVLKHGSIQEVDALAHMYETGDGVTADRSKAIALYKKLAAIHEPYAEKKLRELQKK